VDVDGDKSERQVEGTLGLIDKVKVKVEDETGVLGIFIQWSLRFTETFCFDISAVPMTISASQSDVKCSRMSRLNIRIDVTVPLTC
jgi:hypothetical protein